MPRLAFDIGGTFTDFVLHDESSNDVYFWKCLSTPSDPSKGVLTGLQALLAATRVESKKIVAALHATTVAANAVIERKGSRIALITTRGFRDIAIMGRQKRYDTYDLYLDKPRPLLRRRDIFEVDERVDAYGEIIQSLSVPSVEAVVPRLREGNYAAVAVCLIHSYANPAHEQKVRDILRTAIPGVEITISSEISPKIREFERTSTTVANAYVQPIVKNYLTSLQRSLQNLGVNPNLFVMQSSGGLVPPELASVYPIRIVESGPAAGVLMCANIGRAEKCDHVLTFDMGGTTAKLGAVDNGEPAVTATFEIAQERFRSGSGLPLNIPSVELLEIGAGGGSIAATKMGIIYVGPESAGADPGPMCYGLGGTRATVTDANLVLGYLNPDYFNGGAMRLDRGAAESGIRDQIATPLGLSVGEAAWGVHRVANSNMERAMRIVSVERGRNPRDYALVAFGGAGPLHAARLARELGIPKVIIPTGAGVGSAVGLLDAENKIDVALSHVALIGKESSELIRGVYRKLEQLAKKDLDKLGADPTRVKWSRYAYMRYLGQGHERKIDLPSGPIGDDYAGKVVDAFNEGYKKNYGYLDPDAVIESVDWYLVAAVPATANVLDFEKMHRPSSQSNVAEGTRDVYMPEASGYTKCPVYNRYQLSPGVRIKGPAIVEERESTTVILPGDTATISASGSLVIAIKQES